jgi:hypothetical protein
VDVVEVSGGVVRDHLVKLEAPDRSVTWLAEQAAHSAGVVVVID